MKVAILSNFPVHVIPEFGEGYRPAGHYATWLPQLSRAFSRHPSLELHWITLNDKVGTARTVTSGNQSFHALPCEPNGRASTFFHKDRAALQACLDGIRPQLVHGWGNEDVYALATVLSGYPHVVSIQGLMSHYVLKSIMNPRDYFQALVEMFVLYRADFITAESEWARRHVLRRNPFATTHVVEYGVENDFLKMEWRPSAQRPIVLFAGSAIARKGIQDLIAAFADPALDHAELWIAGDADSPLAVRLRATSSPNVKWLGRKTNLEVGALMTQAWCLAIPTRADTGPTVVKEARVIGLPIVSTPCGGQTSYVEEGRNGFLVAPGDIASLTRSLVKVLGDFDTCLAMGAWLREEHRRILHPERTAENFLNLYQQRIDPSLSAAG